MNPKKKKASPLMMTAVVLLLLALGLCAVVAGIWLQGKNSLAQSGQTPDLPVQQEEIPPQDEPPEVTEEPPGEQFVEYGGKRYKYNTNMVNILLLGIDSQDDPSQAATDYEQADVLVLAAMDLAKNKLTLINLSRDTVTDIEIVDGAGEQAGLLHTQLALAYAYGDGRHESCRLTREAVSNIFYGLPIQGYAAYYLSGIEELNDAVGGVSVKILDDYPFDHLAGYRNMTHGHTVRLTGKQAKMYIQARLDEQVDANDLRMQRQKQYMLALVSQAKAKVAEDPASVLGLYGAVEDYILTDLGIGEVSYLGTKAAGMDFSGEIRSLTGELLLNEENMAEFHVDQEAMFQLMLEVFYNEAE